MQVREEYKEAYERYLNELDNREKRGLKPISFDDYLWEEAYKVDEYHDMKAHEKMEEKYNESF